jgi:hypothetical protein
MHKRLRGPGKLNVVEMAWPTCASLSLHVLLVLMLYSTSAYYPVTGVQARFDVIWATSASLGRNFPLQDEWYKAPSAMRDSGGVDDGCSAEIPPCPSLRGGVTAGLALTGYPFGEKTEPAAKGEPQDLEVYLVSVEVQAPADAEPAAAMPARIIPQREKPRESQKASGLTAEKAVPQAWVPLKRAEPDARKPSPAVAVQHETPLVPELQDDTEDDTEPVAAAAPDVPSIPAVKKEEEHQRASEHDLEVAQVRLPGEKAGAEPPTGVDSRKAEPTEGELNLEQARLSSALEEANRQAAQRAREKAEREKAEAQRLSRQTRLSQEQEEHKRLRAERERLDREKSERAERERISQKLRLSQERQELKRQAAQRHRTEKIAKEKAQRDKIPEKAPPLRAQQEAKLTSVPQSRAENAAQKITGRAAIPVPELAPEGKVAALKEKNIDPARLAAQPNPLTRQQVVAASPVPLARQQENRPAQNSAATQPAGRAATGADRTAAVKREPAQTLEKGKGTKPSEQPRQPRGLVIAAPHGDLKLVMKGDTGIKISVRFRDYPKNRRSKALTRSEGRRAENVVPVLAATREDTREAVIETAREGVYTFSADPEGAKGARASFTLKAFESGTRERIAVLGTRTISGTTVLVKILMPEAILWSDESAFTGSMEDSESETKFNAATGLFWKEFHD